MIARRRAMRIGAVANKSLPHTKIEEPNVRIYILCHNKERFALAKQLYAKYYWAHPIMMKYQDCTFENAFWKQLLEIKSEWEECDMIGTLSSIAHKKISIESINKVIRQNHLWANGYYNFMNSTQIIGATHAGDLCRKVIDKLGLTDTTESYCNYWMTTPTLMRLFIDWFESTLKPAVLTTEGIMDNANYKGTCSEEELLALCGVPHYPWVPFVIERLNKCFFTIYVDPYKIDSLTTLVNRRIICHIHVSTTEEITYWDTYIPILATYFKIIVTYNKNKPEFGDNCYYMQSDVGDSLDAIQIHIIQVLISTNISYDHIIFMNTTDSNIICKSSERIQLINSLLNLDTNILCVANDMLFSSASTVRQSYIIHKKVANRLFLDVSKEDSASFTISCKIISILSELKGDYIALTNDNITKTYNIKVNAIYFPQYHNVPENNSIWGEGFTEWTLLKPAPDSIQTSLGSIPIFKPHADIGYYTLDDPKTLLTQIDMATSYGINGFILYHYWFSDEQKVMYKPLERFLSPEITFPFCIAWANENWTKRWDGLNNEILIEQKYGNYEAHINYLLQFMKMPNYLRNDLGECIIYIYNIASIPELDKMLEIWYAIASKENILLKVIGFKNSFKENDSIKTFPKFSFEPLYTSRFIAGQSRGLEYTYSIKDIIRKYYDKQYNTDCHLGMTVGWNNIVRRKNKHYAWESDCTIENMKDLLIMLLAKLVYKNKSSFKKGPEENDENFININAWNEWNEQAILEPSNVYGYAILKMIRDVIQNT